MSVYVKMDGQVKIAMKKSMNVHRHHVRMEQLARMALMVLPAVALMDTQVNVYMISYDYVIVLKDICGSNKAMLLAQLLHELSCKGSNAVYYHMYVLIYNPQIRRYFL